MKTWKMTGWIAAGLVACSLGHARQIDGLGVGVMVGEPTGISLKKWIGEDRAWDAGIAWSFSENDSLHFHADYLIHRFDQLNAGNLEGPLAFYYGVGARVKLREGNNGRGRNDDDALVGIRVPFGITYLFEEAPADLFVEIIPILDLVPDSDLDLNAAVGFRYYF